MVQSPYLQQSACTAIWTHSSLDCTTASFSLGFAILLSLCHEVQGDASGLAPLLEYHQHRWDFRVQPGQLSGGRKSEKTFRFQCSLSSWLL